MKIRILLFLSALSFFVLGPGGGLGALQQDAGSTARRVIIFVWDGLRADDVTPENMPNYFALARSGVVFADHHAVYPTFTMMNSASIATGTYPGVHGFYGNVVYAPNARGKNAKGVEIDFSAPAFIEDFGVVEAVRESYQGKLTLVSTMLQAAQAKGLSTAAIGKFGAAFIQDYKRGGIIVDEDAAMPLSFAKELQKAGYALPRNTINAYDAGTLALDNDNGAPTAPIAIQRLNDGQTANPLDRTGALSRRGFTYLTDVFVNYILPNKKPDLTVFWPKAPDATNHAYGPGTYNSIDATKMNDEILGRVMDKIRQLGWEQSTDIIITQDHNHSTVSGDVAHYPLRGIDTLPTANVDIAPTVARILTFNMPGVQGRVLEEALKVGPRVTEYTVLGKIYRSSKKTGLKVKLPIDLNGRTIDPNLTTYSVELRTKILTRDGTSYIYFDQARAIRE